MTSDNDNGKPLELTAREKTLLQDTWKLISTSEKKAGVLLFQRLFQNAPQVMNYFSGDGKLDATSEEFQWHIDNVMSTIGKAIGMIDQLQDLVPDLQDLGLAHSVRGISPESFWHVKTAFLQVAVEEFSDVLSEESGKAWSKVLDIFILTMQSGIDG